MQTTRITAPSQPGAAGVLYVRFSTNAPHRDALSRISEALTTTSGRLRFLHLRPDLEFSTHSLVTVALSPSPFTTGMTGLEATHQLERSLRRCLMPSVITRWHAWWAPELNPEESPPNSPTAQD